MLDPDVRRQLREVAEAATEAEVWRKLDEGCTLMLVKGGQSLGVVTLSELLHLHSADPATVLSLLDALDEADEKRDCWRATAEEAQEAAGEWLAAAEVQQQTDANERHKGQRSALGLRLSKRAAYRPEDTKGAGYE